MCAYSSVQLDKRRVEKEFTGLYAVTVTGTLTERAMLNISSVIIIQHTVVESVYWQKTSVMTSRTNATD